MAFGVSGNLAPNHLFNQGKEKEKKEKKKAVDIVQKDLHSL